MGGSSKKTRVCKHPEVTSKEIFSVSVGEMFLGSWGPKFSFDSQKGPLVCVKT